MAVCRTVICPCCNSEFSLSEELSAREKEIALLVAKGMTAKCIAKKLCIADKTVKCHLSTIYSKLSLSNRVDLTKYFLQKGEMTINEINLYCTKSGD